MNETFVEVSPPEAAVGVEVEVEVEIDCYAATMIATEAAVV